MLAHWEKNPIFFYQKNGNSKFLHIFGWLFNPIPIIVLDSEMPQKRTLVKEVLSSNYNLPVYWSEEQNNEKETASNQSLLI